MNLFRRLILSFALTAAIFPAMAQAPAPVPALPDAERRTSYSISGTTCACNVNFALYGDSTDYQNWLEVWLNGVRVNFNDATFGWTITSPSGSLANLARPISDAKLTFNSVQTGTVQIVGARRPRRTTTFNESTGVPTRNLNQVFNDEVAMLREFWDRLNDMTGRTLAAPPGETVGTLPPAATRAGAILVFDAFGNPTTTSPGVGTGNVLGPGSSVNNDVACWNGTSGALLRDCGAIGTTTLTGDITGGPAVGTVPTTLATVNPNVGTFGSTTAVAAVVLDGKGRATAASNIPILPANIGAVPATRQVLGGAGMTAGGALSADLTLGLATIPAGTILANNTGGAAAPGDLTPSQVLDILGAVQGDVLCRNATQWVVLPPGTNGQLLTSGGPGANCSWTTASGTGTVTSVGPGTGIITSPNPIVGAGTVALIVPVTTPNGGTGVVSPATHTIPINQGASAQANTGTGIIGQSMTSGGPTGDPAWRGGVHILLNTLTASNSATLSDTTNITATYNEYEIVFENVFPVTNSVQCEIQVHSGGSFQTTSYLTSLLLSQVSGIVVTAPTTFIPCSQNTADSTGSGISGKVSVFTPSNVANPKTWTGHLFNRNSGPLQSQTIIGGVWNGGNGAIDGFQVLMSSGNIASGTIKIYGIL